MQLHYFCMTLKKQKGYLITLQTRCHGNCGPFPQIKIIVLRDYKKVPTISSFWVIKKTAENSANF